MTYHGRINCYLNEEKKANSTLRYGPLGNEIYINTFQFFQTLTGSGLVDLIAYSTGSALSGALGNGLGFWTDNDNRAGGNSWSVWRVNSSSQRPWDWYFHIQYAEGGGGINQIGAGLGPGDQTPYAVLAGTPASDGTLVQVGWQCALSYNTSTGVSSNPWNGTINADGTDTKGLPLWVTGAVGDELAVFPTMNSDASYSTNKNLFGAIYGIGNIATARIVNFNIVSLFNERDVGFVFLCWEPEMATPTLNYAGYFGTYQPRMEITESVKCPLVGFSGQIANNASPLRTSGNTLVTSGAAGLVLSSSETFSLVGLIPGQFTETTNFIYRSNVNDITKEKLELEPFVLYASNLSGRGKVGICPPQILMKAYTIGKGGTKYHHSSRDFALVGGAGSPSYQFWIPWTGSLPIYSYGSKTGSLTF